MDNRVWKISSIPILYLMARLKKQEEIKQNQQNHDAEHGRDECDMPVGRVEFLFEDRLALSLIIFRRRDYDDEAEDACEDSYDNGQYINPCIAYIADGEMKARRQKAHSHDGDGSTNPGEIGPLVCQMLLGVFQLLSCFLFRHSYHIPFSSIIDVTQK